MRLVFISDTHGHEIDVPDGDVLIHCGDLTGRGTVAQVESAARWLKALPHRTKFAVAGNHDWALYRPASADYCERAMFDANVHYLRDCYFSLPDDGFTIYGSPWTPEFCGWAFMREDSALGDIYRETMIHRADVVVTHGPPLGVLDESSDGHPCGSKALLAAVRRVRPQIHAFGHIHEGYGTVERDGTLFVNAATCTLEYEPTNPPVVIDYDTATRTPVVPTSPPKAAGGDGEKARGEE